MASARHEHMHLADALDVPLRERNRLLLAAGHAPAYGQRDLAEPGTGRVREALDRVLVGSIEAFFPADETTAGKLRAMAAG
jgi:hypothetical protein